MKPSFGLRSMIRVSTRILCFSTTASIALAASQDLIEPATFSQADFRQERHVAVLDRALVSRGSIIVTDRGFIWHQTRPFRNTLSYDGGTLLETTDSGGTDIVRKIQDPIAVGITDALFSIATGSWESLQSTFNISAESVSVGMTWTVNLQPKDERIRTFMPMIRVSGNHYIEKIHIQQSGTDFTLIELSEQSPPQ